MHYDTHRNEGFWYLHHEHQFVVGEVIVVNRDPPDILTQRRLDDQLSRQIQLVERFLHFFLFTVCKYSGQRTGM